MAEPGGYNQGGRAPKASEGWNWIKNKNAAAVQITAEQLIREAYERQGSAQTAVRQKVLDGEELGDYQMRRRREFEEGVRRNRSNMGEWLRYAAWEEAQGAVSRARSVFERALDVDARSQAVYVKYAELEMKHENVNLARNVYDRAVSVLPRVSQFWYRYAYMEELLGNVDAARAVFERWMQWEPSRDAWLAYVKLERRYGEAARARQVFARLAHVHPEPDTWLRWAQFEEAEGDADRVRAVFGQAIDRLGEQFMDQRVFVAFAGFETRMREPERARAIYAYALARLPRAKAQALYSQYVRFEKQHGGAREIEQAVVGRRRAQHEARVRADAHDYDAWLEYARLEEEAGDRARARDVYERAAAAHPRVADKALWRRYVYVWLFYALFEERTCGNVARARRVYEAALELVPHAQFTFAKLWLQYAWFEVRQRNVAQARRRLGQALGVCPKRKLFRGYIALELELREFDRVRRLYAKHVEFSAASCAVWVEFAQLEQALGEHERCRALFELAVAQPVLDMPEVLWKAYIDFEQALGNDDATRALYARLLQLTDHVKVWVSCARFELRASGLPAARAVFERGSQRLRALAHGQEPGQEREQHNQERVALLDAWREVEEQTQGGEPARVVAQMPRRVRRRRELDDGSLEEYFDYVFPDDEQGARFKLLAKAHQWKQGQTE
ncbi:NineTeen Complex (NTC) component [Coemansia sp. Cherry 401B]|nr:NineTeen Complex (NTC) component [Coemansia sp. Cherry 401B]